MLALTSLTGETEVKKQDVVIGGVYVAKVSGNLVRVRIDSASEYGGWKGTNLSTKREVRIKTAGKLRQQVGKAVSKEEQRATELRMKEATDKINADLLKSPLSKGSVGERLAAIPSKGGTVKENNETPSTPPNGTEAKPANGSLSPSGAVLEAPSTPSVVSTPIPLPATNTAPKHRLSELIGSKADRGGVDTAPHLIVRARAGTGKTTTLVEGLKRVKGLPSTLVPSPQQAAVWLSMEASQGKVNSIAFVAFNKSIATELQQRMPAGCEAMTLHSLGLKAVTKAFGRVKVESYRVQNLISEILEKDIREIRKNEPTLIKATEDLVALCKQNLIGYSERYEAIAGRSQEDWEFDLEKLANYYDVELNGSRSKVFDLVPRVLERCRDVAADGQIDFNDMIWLPVALGLPVYRYDLLLVDEAQDLNRCQQQLALKAGRRLILCGDDRQAIYGFAGADAESLPRMEGILKDTERGVMMLPLTVTRRCGKAIVAKAKELVPDFEAFESNSEGKISQASYADTKYTSDEEGCSDPMHAEPAGPVSYRAQVKDGDFILCRCNAPLVSQCFRFLREGRKANIQGRDIGQGLISTIKKLKAETVVDLISRLSDWHSNETRKVNAQRNPSEAKLIALDDRRDCLMAFTEEAKTVEEVIEKIERVFTDTSTGGIRLSSGHRAKGLEAKRVFILQVKGATCPHPMAKSPWQKAQEMNLLYVMYTRAIDELVIVS